MDVHGFVSKIVSDFGGNDDTILRSNVYYKATGVAMSEPKRQMKTMLITEGERAARSALPKIRKVIEEDGVPVRGYFHWSLFDNLEWSSGYKVKFGLCGIDPTTKRRTPKASATVFKRISQANALP